YTDEEMYALSYNGLENAYAGLPTCCAPSPEALTYWQGANPSYQAFANGGKGASVDSNVGTTDDPGDLYNFIKAVQAYTGSSKVDIVAHSLGGPIVRKTLSAFPDLRNDVLAAVIIAGATHGTSVCRDIEVTYYGCEEISPLEDLPNAQTLTTQGDPNQSNGRLYNLNHGCAWSQTDTIACAGTEAEAPGPTKWEAVYNGTDNADPFFVQVPGVFDDRQSPRLDTAINVTCPGTYHNDLRVRPDIVDTYLQFLLSYGEAPGMRTDKRPYAGPAATVACGVDTSGFLPADVPEVTAAALLPLGGTLAGGVVLWTRRRRTRAKRPRNEGTLD
ncbi:MAG: hypothetical protein ABR498_05830, partial [Candidatus Dormibacteria bacterium]